MPLERVGLLILLLVVHHDRGVYGSYNTLSDIILKVSELNSNLANVSASILTNKSRNDNILLESLNQCVNGSVVLPVLATLKDLEEGNAKVLTTIRDTLLTMKNGILVYPTSEYLYKEDIPQCILSERDNTAISYGYWMTFFVLPVACFATFMEADLIKNIFRSKLRWDTGLAAVVSYMSVLYILLIYYSAGQLYTMYPALTLATNGIFLFVSHVNEGNDFAHKLFLLAHAILLLGITLVSYIPLLLHVFSTIRSFLMPSS